MIRILICEFITGGGFATVPLPDGLLHEGDAMLQALLRDLSEIDSVASHVCRDTRLPGPELADTVLWCSDADDPWQKWRAALQDCDCFWPIAPESGGALERLVRMAEQAGVPVIGCSANAIACCASKSRTGLCLEQHGIAVTPILEPGHLAPGSAPAGWIHKPDDGAGCEDTRFFSDPEALLKWADSHNGIIQPCVEGPSLSLSVLAGTTISLLSVNRQRVRIEQGLVIHEGVEIGIEHPRQQQLASLAQEVVAAVPGLSGYVGIDFIDTEAGPVVVEINPRLTTAWVGLSRHIGDNIAALILRSGHWID